MNGLLFLLPFIIVASLGIYQAEAYRGEDYSNTQNPDGSYSFVAGLPKWIFNGEEFVPFIANGNTVNTATSSITLQSNGTYSFYKNGNHILDDRIVAKYADTSNLSNWTYLNSLNNDLPDVSWDGSGFVATKLNGVGQLEYKYILDNGKWKTQLEATNLSGLTTKAFGFDQIIDLDSDTIKFGGITRNLDNYNGTTFSKAFLDANKGKVLEFLNGVDFDFDLGYENLYAVTVYDTGAGKSRLVFDYRTSTPLLPNDELIIDPTFTSSIPTSGKSLVGGTTAAGTCDTTYASNTATLSIKKANAAVVDDCRAVYLNFDTSSLGMNITAITSAAITYDISSMPIAGGNCDWKHLGFTGGNNSATMAAIISDTGDVIDALSNTTSCTTIGNDKGDYFGSSVFTRIVNDINTDNIISLGIFFTNNTRYTGVDYDVVMRASDAILNFTYMTTQLAPDKITNVGEFIAPTATTVGLNWTAPTVYGSQTIIGYQINVTTPETNSPLVYLNDTGTTVTNYNVTGLSFGAYSASISAWTNNTYGHPYNNVTSNIYNFTTTPPTTYSSLAPTNFMMLPNGTSTSILNMNWTAPSMDNLRGYWIQCEAPVGGGFSTVTGNTTTAGTSYNRTGLVVNTYYNCKVAGINSTGATSFSNTYSQTTYHLPDAVDDLVATPTSISDIVLTFTQPNTLYGYLTGYNINYSTPQSSDPLTVYVESTGSSDVAYTLTGLTAQEEYSFRVSAITIHGKNVTGALVANATSADNFSVGEISIPGGTDSSPVPIDIEEVVINSTTSDIVVTYDSSYALSCDLDYMFGNNNQTYTGLTENALTGSRVYSNFTLNGINNDIIDIYCWDTLDMDTNARDRIGQSNGTVPLFDQITSFQGGAFGTSGKFGALDLMTLFIVIISMIGFNRDHPEVGVAITGVTIGICFFYGLIQWETGLTGVVVLIIGLAIANSKRGSSN